MFGKLQLNSKIKIKALSIYARNVRLRFLYRQYINFFIFQFAIEIDDFHLVLRQHGAGKWEDLGHRTDTKLGVQQYIELSMHRDSECLDSN